MKMQRLLIVLTLVNLALLTLALAQIVAPVLRGHALEIVDDQGRVRAAIRVFLADPTVKMPDGTRTVAAYQF